MSILERLAIHDTEIRHLQESMEGMTEFHMQVLYICLGVVIAGVYMILKRRDDDKNK